MLPVLENHDKTQVEVFAYAQAPLSDAVTQRLRASIDCWRDIVGRSDAQVADLIRQDQIDILVDLSMHTAGNRLLVFAAKPAPVQVTWLGYPGSTGLQTIDYRLSDPYLDPLGEDESIYSEQTIRLPDTFWCYDPMDGRDIPINPPPALERGEITFGCLNKFTKLNPQNLALWAKVLAQVKNSRLLLLTDPGSHVQRTISELAGHGIDPARLEFIPRRSHQEYLKLYHRIDIALDTLPYNGHTTTIDGLWMGVPTVSLAGATAVGRAGVSILSNIGLLELIAKSEAQFVQIAVALAQDLPKLSNLRSTLRQRMEQSPLMDAPRFARNIESAYRQMWRTWCGHP
jgi:protein O-GlcNAc transferase